MARAGQQESGRRFLRRRAGTTAVADQEQSDALPWLVRLMTFDEEDPEEFEQVVTAVRRASFLTVVIDEGEHLDEYGENVREWCAIETGPNGGLLAAGPDKEVLVAKASAYLAARGGGQLVVATDTPTRPLRSFVSGTDWRDEPPPEFTVALEQCVPPRIEVLQITERGSTAVGYLEADDQKPLVRHLRAGKGLTLHPRISQDGQGRIDGLVFDLWAEE